MSAEVLGRPLRWGGALEARRRRIGWSVEELADRLGVAPVVVDRWEQGIETPDPALVEIIGVELGVSRGLLDAWRRMSGAPAVVVDLSGDDPVVGLDDR